MGVDPFLPRFAAGEGKVHRPHSSNGRKRSCDFIDSAQLPGVARTARVNSPDAGASISKASIRVPGFGESHSWRGLAVSTTCQPGRTVTRW